MKKNLVILYKTSYSPINPLETKDEFNWNLNEIICNILIVINSAFHSLLVMLANCIDRDWHCLESNVRTL